MSSEDNSLAGSLGNGDAGRHSESIEQPGLAGAKDDFGLALRPRVKSRLVDPLLGSDLGGVKIVRLIGEGGMGRVYEAVQSVPERTVAVKVIRQGITSEKTLRRFEREAQFLAKLRHPGIAQIYIVGTYTSDYGDVPFYVMEHITDAKPITNYCFEKKVSIAERLRLFTEVCDAVSHGHDRGIVHRDLKPGNILIDGEGKPRVIDFGVARSTDSDLTLTSMRTDSGNLVGTAQYMSPEQFGPSPDDLDPRTDVYSLGVVLYELLGGVLPHEYRGKGLHEIARMVCEEHPVPLRSLGKEVPRDVARIAHRCLEKNRRDRYHSAGELAADIRRHLAGEPALAAGVGVVCRRILRRMAPRSRQSQVVGLVVAGLVAWAIAFVERNIPKDIPTTRQVRVSDKWSQSGFWVKKDRCYRLSVDGVCHDSIGVRFGPDGTCPVEFRTVLGPIKDLPAATRSQAYVGQHPIRALIAKIGDKPWTIHVGPGLTFVAPASGQVALRINEPTSSTENPQGSLQITLEAVPTPTFVDDEGRTEIWANVDDSDHLLLTPRGLQWEYGGSWARVGMHDGVFPTLVNNVAWWPDWSDPVRSSVLATTEFQAAAEGKQRVTIRNVNARHGRVQVEAPADGIVRIQFRDTELGSGDIGCTLVLSDSVLPVNPSVGVPACELLAAKKDIEGLATGAIAFMPPRGNGRSGARGIALPAPRAWEMAGSRWAFDYVARGSAQGFQVVHPYRSGHVIVTLTRRRKNVTLTPGGSWHDIGWDGGNSLPIVREAAFQDALVLPEWDIDARVESVLRADGRYELRFNGKKILGAHVTNAVPFQFGAGFERGGLPGQLPAGHAMLIVGPIDGPIANQISHARLDTAE